LVQVQVLYLKAQAFMLQITVNPQVVKSPALVLRRKNPAQHALMLPTKGLSKIFYLWTPVLVCAGFIFFASSIPGSKVPGLFPYQDIAFHFIAYLLLALFFARAFKNTYVSVNVIKLIIFTFIFTLFYGISDEFHQMYVPGRNVSGFDLLIDGLGGFFGGLIYIWRK